MGNAKTIESPYQETDGNADKPSGRAGPMLVDDQSGSANSCQSDHRAHGQVNSGRDDHERRPASRDRDDRTLLNDVRPVSRLQKIRGKNAESSNQQEQRNLDGEPTRESQSSLAGSWTGRLSDHTLSPLVVGYRGH
jgi:hypothetical protein